MPYKIVAIVPLLTETWGLEFKWLIQVHTVPGRVWIVQIPVSDSVVGVLYTCAMLHLAFLEQTGIWGQEVAISFRFV